MYLVRENQSKEIVAPIVTVERVNNKRKMSENEGEGILTIIFKIYYQ